MRGQGRNAIFFILALGVLFHAEGAQAAAGEDEKARGDDPERGALEVVTQIEINAEPARVWAILTDFPAMASWNPFIRSLKGRSLEGERIEAQIAPPGQSTMTFKPVLLAVRPERELRWLGSLVAPGLFDGEHAFLLEALPGGRTKFVQSERFSGLFAPLIMSGSRLQATLSGFAAMNDALKRRAEAR